MPFDEQSWVRLAIALGIGIERERRKGEGPARTIAGVRSFAVTALPALRYSLLSDITAGHRKALD